MATKSPKPNAYNDATQYRVQLKARLNVLGQSFYPGADLTLRGDVLNALTPDAIASATPVNPSSASS